MCPKGLMEQAPTLAEKNLVQYCAINVVQQLRLEAVEEEGKDQYRVWIQISPDRANEVAETQHFASEAMQKSAPLVLIIDDDRSTRATLRFTLERDGFQVEVADNGEQALEMLKQQQPDVILLDAIMPVMDGFETCERMRDMPGKSEIPVLMITALDDQASVDRAYDLGVTEFIPKPVPYAVLSQRVRRVVSQARADKGAWKQGDEFLLITFRKAPRQWSSLDRFVRHARDVYKFRGRIVLDI